MTNSEYINVYEAYSNIKMHEGRMFWERFKIFLSINVGAIAILGFILKLNTHNISWMEVVYLLLIALLCMIGFKLGCYWEKITINSKTWHDKTHEKIINLEDLMNIPGADMFRHLDKVYTNLPKDEPSTVDIAINISAFFKKIWLLAFWMSIIIAIIVCLLLTFPL